MASIRKRGDTYQIRVSVGYDIHGRQIMKTKTWKPDPNWTTKRIEKELNKAAVQFEKDVTTGHYVDGSIRFEEFAEKWMKEYAEKNLRPKTIARYHALLTRIYPAIGHIKVEQVQPMHLMEFYNNLGEAGIKNAAVCQPVINIDAERKKQKISKMELSRRSGASYSSVVNACKGLNIRQESAEQIAKALGLKWKKSFQIIKTEEKLSSSTVVQHHRLISSIMESAVKWGLIIDNPCRRVQTPKVVIKKGVTLSSEETIRMFECLADAPEKYRTAITVLVYTGLRRGELSGLKWSDVNFEKGILTVNGGLEYLPSMGLYEEAPKTENGKRSIKLPASALNILKEHRRMQAEDKLKLGDRWQEMGYIFTKWDGTPMHPDSLYQWFSRFVKQNNLPPITLHSLRHTNASLMIANGIDLATVSKRLGHADTSITARVYTHAIKEADAIAAEALENLFLQDQKVKKDA